MLDEVTKRRINSLRDILVGVLPDPKSQVEQITNALIYKFMNDMDEESINMGGRASFFFNEYEKYSWNNLMSPKTTGVERVRLYREALESFYLNPNLPTLFREIFKDSNIPFNNPSMLNMFLKEINEFHYSNSENLGDAFEHLLSYMGSQGDAGQFRTPRHIIDFIVEIISPQKHETILDPACGTAGFLISSYKYILRNNSKNKKSDLLSASEVIKLGENLSGYDISPDMVKISLVNMFLHNFKKPKIFEYDALSSEERWNEYYDVILANPPFFSPKGGITPHNRFGVNSTKAEILFIDYINEHLKPNGRAGIIVPEGIIFQKGNAYKKLRKRLLETSLIGIISLPAGVFQPYSGVKTSILILDKEKNKVRKNIFFIDLKNDGYSLSANRNSIKENDIPIYLEKIKNNFEDLKSFNKEDILKNSDFSFNLKSYFAEESKNSNFTFVNLTDFCELYQPKTITQKELVEDGKYLVYGANGVIGRYNSFNHKNSEIAITCRGATCGTINLTEPFSWITGNAMVCKILNLDDLNKKYLFYLLKNSDLSSLVTGSAQPQITRQNFSNFKIPLPPIKYQSQIADELDSYQNVIDGCKQVVENYKPSIDIDPNWESVDLGELCKISTGKLNANAADENGEYPFFTCSKEIFKINNYAYDTECLLLSGNNASGNYDVKHYKGKFNAYQRTYIIEIKDKYLKKINYEILKSIIENQLSNLKNLSSGSLTKYLTLPIVKSIKVYLLPQEIIQSKTQILKNDKKIIENNKELINRINNKIIDRVNSIWSS